MHLAHPAFEHFKAANAWLVALAIAVAMQAWPNQARGTLLEDPSGTITTVSTSPNFTYAMTIKDASDATEPIGTVWFAWVPGEDFLTTSPLSETSPAGWNVNAITHGGPSDGYAIQWLASSAASDIPAGGSLSGFGFTTADSPASIAGKSPFYPTTPVLTTFAYSAAPFSDAGTQFAVTPVPEPASLAVAVLPIAMLLRRPRREGQTTCGTPSTRQ
jgi:hypothetical protein